MNKYIIGVIILIIAGLGFYFSTDRVKTTVIDKDTTFSNEYILPENERVEIKNGAVLTLEGPAIILGEIRGDENGVALVVKNDFTLEKSGSITGNGNVQIVADISLLLKTEEEVNKAFDEAGKDSGDGPRVGPIVPNDGKVSFGESWKPKQFSITDKTIAIITRGTEKAYAQEEKADTTVDIFGRIDLSNADAEKEKERKRLVLLSFPPSAGKVQMNLVDLDFVSPQNTPKGIDDIENSCNAKGGDGSDGLRLRAIAWGIDINNVTIQLTKGGDGGDATTKEDCEPGVAVGGLGGDSGNMKFTATGRLVISGAFHIIPGKGGNGGEALAFGKDGELGEVGGDAKATGGNGADNNKKLSVEGNVIGTDNITVDELFGGNGGGATASGGLGGNNVGCGNYGGSGGSASAIGGKGGDASLTVFGVSSPVLDVGGVGGEAGAIAGTGGRGGDCDSTGPGGEGGGGGDSTAVGGKGGKGDTVGADGGTIEPGGNGGNGGDGCLSGAGGFGGSGDPDGEEGSDGKNLCVEVKDKTELNVVEDVSTGEPAVVVVGTKMSYAHVAPGEYSEVYMDITGPSGASVSVKLSGPAVEQASASGTIDNNGKLSLKWTIYQFGVYSASGTVGEVSISDSVNVVQ